MPEWLTWIYAGLIGAAVGSFLNVCVHRWPLDLSVITPRSRCPGCEEEIAWYHNIPVLGWLVLRGRCSSCDQRISVQYPAVELATALLWAASAAFVGFDLDGLRAAVFLTILLGIALTDARHYIIPDQFSLGGLVLGLAFAAMPGGFAFTSALLGAAVGFGLLWLVAVVGEWVFKQPAMGGGDVKMMAMIGSFLGAPGVLLTLFLGALFGSVIFGPITLKTGKLVPFGIFLALGAAITFVWGDALVALYVETFFAV